MPQSAWACEVPSFVVDDSPLIWGQDCLNVMQDMMCGWTQSEQTVNTHLFLCACSLPVCSFISITLDAYNRRMVTGWSSLEDFCDMMCQLSAENLFVFRPCNVQNSSIITDWHNITHLYNNYSIVNRQYKVRSLCHRSITCCQTPQLNQQCIVILAKQSWLTIRLG